MKRKQINELDELDELDGFDGLDKFDNHRNFDELDELLIAGVYGGPPTKKVRAEDSITAHDHDDNYDLEAYDSQSDEDSEDNDDAASTLPSANTPSTPLSPARKYPSDIKKIKCTYDGCTKTFNRPARLAAHLRSHENARPFKCTFPGCDKDYIEEKHLRQHVKGAHTSDRPHVCSEPGCDKRFLTATRLRRHQEVHEGQDRFRCRDYPPCNKSFRKHHTLQSHIRSDHLHMAAYPCSHVNDETGFVCGAAFKTSGALKKHQQRGHGEIRYWCDECANQEGEDGQPKKVGFTTQCRLRVHMLKEHVYCMFCGVACTGKTKLAEHIESEHANQKPAKPKTACVYPGCTKTFVKRSNMNMHIRSSHQGYQFFCGDFDLSGTPDIADWTKNHGGCGDGFTTKANLENHIRYVHMKLAREPPAGQHDWETPPETNLVNTLSGAGGESSSFGFRCTVPSCGWRFDHTKALESHLLDHTVESLIDGGECIANASPEDDTTNGTTGREKIWNQELLARDSETDRLTSEDDIQWSRDHNEMRQLIGPDPSFNQPNEPEPFDQLIDPTLYEL
ncbi:hypothetical protein F5B20DRAFT_547837 [Whalleya microplaca]|nr:hypothetical protein F5B20DRAFT_547837 [Whalleya microplaca]